MRSTVRVSAFGHQRALHYCSWYCGPPLFYGTLFSMVDMKPIVKTGNTVGVVSVRRRLCPCGILD
jgi:hypothetical protein